MDYVLKLLTFVVLFHYCQGQQARCRGDMNSLLLPECLQKYVKNGIINDGNGSVCKTKSYTSSKTTADVLLQQALQIAQGGAQCRGEMGPRNMGRRKKRQPDPQQSCGAGAGAGNCETDTTRLPSIYIERDLGDKILIITNGVPDHCYRDGMEDPNPNRVCEHFRMLLVPKRPVKGSVFQEHPMGPVGIAKSGAFFFNHLSGEATCNVAAISEKPSFDTCDGHPAPDCKYHYHKAPVCIPGFNNCALLGYTNDGVPMYGKCSITMGGMVLPFKSCYRLLPNKNGCDKSHYLFDRSTQGCNLDEANGFQFYFDVPTSGDQVFHRGDYAYFFTPEYPFIMPGSYGDKSQVKWCILDG